MEELKSAINWFEIPVANFDRALRFYSDIYDIELPARNMGQLMMGFFPHQPGVGTGGAIVAGDGYVPGVEGVKIYLNAGSDLNTVLNRVNKAGGTVVQAKTEISPDVGYFAIIEDTECNRIYLHSMN